MRAFNAVPVLEVAATSDHLGDVIVQGAIVDVPCHIPIKVRGRVGGVVQGMVVRLENNVQHHSRWASTARTASVAPKTGS